MHGSMFVSCKNHTQLSSLRSLLSIGLYILNIKDGLFFMAGARQRGICHFLVNEYGDLSFFSLSFN